MNVTPLVDVVLVLLIIFMVILPAAVSDMNLELAKMENPDEERKGEPDPYVLSIDVDGRLYLDDYVVTKDQLGAHLRAANANDPNKKLIGYAGKIVKVTGKVTMKSHNYSITLEKVDEVKGL